MLKFSPLQRYQWALSPHRSLFTKFSDLYLAVEHSLQGKILSSHHIAKVYQEELLSAMFMN
jgi:hypothetical protein